MSMIHSSSAAAGLQIGAQLGDRQVQDGQVHRVEQAGQRQHGQADPLAAAGLLAGFRGSRGISFVLQLVLHRDQHGRAGPGVTDRGQRPGRPATAGRPGRNRPWGLPRTLELDLARCRPSTIASLPFRGPVGTPARRGQDHHTAAEARRQRPAQQPGHHSSAGRSKTSTMPVQVEGDDLLDQAVLDLQHVQGHRPELRPRPACGRSRPPPACRLARVTRQRNCPNQSLPKPPCTHESTTMSRPVQVPGSGGMEKRTSSLQQARPGRRRRPRSVADT